MYPSLPNPASGRISNPLYAEAPSLPSARDASPELILTIPDECDRGHLIFSLSFCRWLLAAFDQVELIAEPPSPTEWGAITRAFLGREMAQPGDFGFARPFRVEDSLRVHFAERPLEAPAPPVFRDASRTATDWALLPTQHARPSRVIVRALPSGAASQCSIDQASLWVALIPARVEAFMQYYLRIRSTASKRGRAPRFFAIVDRSGPDHELKKIRVAWDTVTERFLGRTVPILGQVDFSGLAHSTEPAGRKVRACEETLGPPWPSDLQAYCHSPENARILETGAASPEQPASQDSAASLLLQAEACRPG